MKKDLRIVWWNVKFTKFARSNRYVVKALEKMGWPEVICLQEFVDGMDDRLAKELKKRKYDIEYVPFAYRKEISQGVMTAIKQEFKAEQITHVLREDKPMRRRPFPNIRGIVETRLHINGSRLVVINFHSTYARRHTRDMRHREFESLKNILEKDLLGKKWILGGDFNFVGRDSRKHYFTNNYAFRTGTLFKKTWRWLLNGSPITANIDYVVWNGLEHIPSFELKPFFGSDHRPMLVTIPSTEFTEDR